MKQLFYLFILSAICLNEFAQTTGRIENLKDAWDISYDYVGEIKNGKPNGMGVAIYKDGNVTRYDGHFVNGFYSGRGTMLFKNGAVLTGNWNAGKLSGKGSNLTENGALYVGDYINGLRNGTGILIFKENGFYKGQFKNDQYDGKGINVWSDGSIISDNEYTNDKRNGMGFQYEAADKKLYEGEWRDDKWVEAGTASFYSFLKHPDLISEKNDQHILIGPVNNSGYLKDTAFFYDLAIHKKYFGYYENGNLKNGILIRDDSSRFIGQLNDKGATGYCYDFKFNKYFDEGDYVDDYLNGDIISIDLSKKTVYFGNVITGEFSGKAYFFNNKNEMYAGDYLKGRFTGTGYWIESSGRAINGTWEDGIAKQVSTITTAKGEIIPGKPKTLSEALNIVIKTYPDYFSPLKGELTDDWDLFNISEDDSSSSLYSSLITFPGSIDEDEISLDFDKKNLYTVKFIKTKDEAKVIAKYNELAKQLQACTVINSYFKNSLKLKGTVNVPDLSKEKNETIFDLPSDKAEYKNFHIWLTVSKDFLDNDFIVSLKIGSDNEE